MNENEIIDLFIAVCTFAGNYLLRDPDRTTAEREEWMQLTKKIAMAMVKT